MKEARHSQGPIMNISFCYVWSSFKYSLSMEKKLATRPNISSTRNQINVESLFLWYLETMITVFRALQL